ncbi:MAG TPA: nuclear transport factor 2 family protein [Solirubrobacteraceae bacterium]|nr:nuclear transport factor 2 family protein [Solirubrobacteraceae bacterium]
MTTGAPSASAVIDAINEVSRTGDMTNMAPFWHEDLLMHAEGVSPLGGVHRGIDDVLTIFPTMHGICEGNFKVTAEDMIVNDAFAVILTRVDAQRPGASVVQRIIAIWRLEDGKVVELWDHFSDLATWDRFWTDSEGEAQPDPPDTAHEAEKVRRTVREISEGGSNAPLEAFFADELVAHIDGEPWFGGEKDRAKLMQSFPKLYELSDGSLKVTPEETFASPHFVAILNRVEATRGDREIDQVLCAIWRLEAGKVVEVWTHIQDAAAWSEFWRDDAAM